MHPIENFYGKMFTPYWYSISNIHNVVNRIDNNVIIPMVIIESLDNEEDFPILRIYNLITGYE